MGDQHPLNKLLGLSEQDTPIPPDATRVGRIDLVALHAGPRAASRFFP
jgi:hypothetical protein